MVGAGRDPSGRARAPPVLPGDHRSGAARGAAGSGFPSRPRNLPRARRLGGRWPRVLPWRAPRPRAVEWRKAAPLRLRPVPSCRGTRTPHVTLRWRRATPCLGTATQAGSREPEGRDRLKWEGGRYAAPGSDVTPRRRPRRLTLELLVPVSAVARTNLSPSQGIDSFFSPTDFITKNEFLRNVSTISSLPSR